MSDDLISRKALLGIERLLMTDIVENNPAAKYILEQVLFDIEHSETAFDKEKVIEEMKKTGKRFCVSARCSEDCQNCEHGVLMKALIEIVKQGGIE